MVFHMATHCRKLSTIYVWNRQCSYALVSMKIYIVLMIIWGSLYMFLIKKVLKFEWIWSEIKQSVQVNK